MKIFLLVTMLLFLNVESHSQVLISLLLGDKLNSGSLEFGLEGGGNFSKISGLETNKFLKDWNLGFYFNIQLKNSWYLYTGVLVKSRLGADKLTENDLSFLRADTYSEEGDYSQKIKYFLVPAIAKYKFKNNIYVEAGPQFGLMYDAWVEFNSDVGGKKARIKEYNEDQINRIDAGLLAGAGYKFKGRTGWTLGIKYYYGLTNIYKERSGTKNSSLFLKVNIPIGASEAAQKKLRKRNKKRKEKIKLNNLINLTK